MKVEYYYKPDSKTLREEPQVFTRWIDPTIEQLQQENKQLKEQLKNKPDVLNITKYLDIIKTYLKEIDRLQQKIDKALKYIDEFTGYYADDDGTAMFVIEELKEETFVKDLLQILGDKENE